MLVGDDPVAVFSGGSLLVGSAGRTDLLGYELAHSLALLQYGSLRRLASLPGTVALCPTHGAGSFCTSSVAGATTSSIESELRTNPQLRYADAERFAAGQLAGLLPFPTYYRHMAGLNLAGPEGWRASTPAELPTDLIEATGNAVVDGRSRYAFAAGHIPGALGVELGTSFASWVGWLVPFGTPVMLVLDPGQDGTLAATELARIGYQVKGVLWGVEVWEASGGQLHRHRTATVAELAGSIDDISLVDVRDPGEWAVAHVRGSAHHYVPDLVATVPDADQPWLICGGGFRSNMAASLLCRRGIESVVVTAGGVPELLMRRPDLRA
jgi:rhodanese-related sulfurtransferase